MILKVKASLLMLIVCVVGEYLELIPSIVTRSAGDGGLLWLGMAGPGWHSA